MCQGLKGIGRVKTKDCAKKTAKQQHMGTPASFKPGQSGNPKGAPKKEWTMRGEIIKALERTTLDGTPLKQGVAEALVDKALQGDVIAIKEISNRTDGMPVQKNVLASDEEHPVLIKLDTK